MTSLVTRIFSVSSLLLRLFKTLHFVKDSKNHIYIYIYSGVGRCQNVKGVGGGGGGGRGHIDTYLCTFGKEPI